MPKSLYEVFERTALQSLGRTAVIEGKTSYRYADLLGDVRRIAAQLQKLGVSRGDRVVICAGNRIETVIGFWAAMAAGGVSVVISDEQPVAKVGYILRDCAAAALVAPAALVNTLATDGLPPALRGAVVVGEEPVLADVRYAHFHETATGLCPVPVISDDLAALIYTSGSTGGAKGVMLSHSNMLAALASLNEYLENTADDVFLCVLPLAFDYGLYQMIMAFSVGASVVLERDMTLPLHVLKDIGRHHCTVIPGVPVLFELLDKFSRFAKPDSNSVRCVTNTGAALLPVHIEAIKRLFPRAAIYSMYGVTECKRCTYLPPHLLDVKPASVGVAIPDTEIMVVDDDDRPCPPLVVGQLIVRGLTVMQGYWGLPEQTAQKIRRHPVTGRRCLYTGDYGYLDHDGCFYFKGRMDEVIKVRGRKLIPRDVEDALRQIDGVLEAAVVCTALGDGDHHVAAFVQADRALVDESVLRTGCRRSLENYQLPNQYEVLEALPRNSNGKIDRLELARRYPVDATLAAAAPAATAGA